MTAVTGAVAALCLLVLLAPAPVAAQARAPVVTAATQVTVNPAPVRAHSSPQIARNPGTGELVVAEADVRGSRSCAVHISVDDGRSWFLGGNPMSEPFTDCTIGAAWGTYFTVVFDRDGTLYIPFAANDPTLFGSTTATGGNGRKFVPRHLFLARSTDGGRTFTTTKVYDAPAGDPARGYAYGVMGAVHPDDPSKVYVTWAQGDFLSRAAKTRAVVAASSDGGRTFSRRSTSPTAGAASRPGSPSTGGGCSTPCGGRWGGTAARRCSNGSPRIRRCR